MATVTSETVSSLSDAQLARGLRHCGVEFGPITETTRDVYRRKLSRLISPGALNADILAEEDKSVTAGAHGVTRTRAATRNRKTSEEKEKNNDAAKNQQETPKLESALAKKSGRKKSKNQKVTWSDMSGSSLDEEDLIEELNIRNTGKDKEQRKSESQKPSTQISKSKDRAEKEEVRKPQPASSNRKMQVIEKEIVVRETKTRSNSKRGNTGNSAIRKNQNVEDDDDDDVNDNGNNDDDDHDDNAYDNFIDNSLKEKLHRVSIQDRFSSSTPKSVARMDDRNGNKFSEISPGSSEVSYDDGYHGSSTRSGNKSYSGGSEEQIRSESFSRYNRSAKNGNDYDYGNGNDYDDYEGDDDDNYNSSDLYDTPLTRPSLHSGSEYRPPIYTSSDRFETRSMQLLQEEPRSNSKTGQLSACLDLLQIRSDIKKKGKNFDHDDNVQGRHLQAERHDRYYPENDLNDDYTHSSKFSQEPESVRMRKIDAEKTGQNTVKDIGRKKIESREISQYDERGIDDLVDPRHQDLDDDFNDDNNDNEDYDDYIVQKSSKISRRYEDDTKKEKLFDSIDDTHGRSRGDVRVHSVQYAEKRNDLQDNMGYMQKNMGEDIRSLPKARKNVKSDEKYTPGFTHEKNAPEFTKEKHHEKKYYADEGYGGKAEVKNDDDSSMMWIIVMIIIIVVVLIAMLY